MASTFLLFLILLVLSPLAVLLLLLAALVRPRPVRVPIKGRHVLVTGGSIGIGLAVARRAAAEGAARVSLLARNPARLAEARDAICLATGVDVATFSVDVRDAAAVARALAEAGPVDVLVCNHGVFLPRELEAQDLEEVRFQLDVNLMGTFHLVKAALPAMKQRARETGIPASIAIVSSMVGQAGIYGYTAYCASKFGLRGLAEALQHELIADNIHISLIFPPDTDTPGLVEELKRRPEITNKIVESCGGMTADGGGIKSESADDVAVKAVNGIKSGSFSISCNFDGTMLSIATAGMSPQRSFLMAFVEVFGAGFLRFWALYIQWKWFTIIQNWPSKKNSEYRL